MEDSNFRRDLLFKTFTGLIFMALGVAGFVATSGCTDPKSCSGDVVFIFLSLIFAVAIMVGVAVLIMTIADLRRGEERVRFMATMEKPGNRPVKISTIVAVFGVLVLMFGEAFFGWISPLDSKYLIVWGVFFVAMYLIFKFIELRDKTT